MEHLRARQKIKKRIYSRTVQIILFVVLILLVRSTWKIYQKHEEAKRSREAAEKELIALQQSGEGLVQKIKELESQRGQDREIREKFGVAKEGEEVVFIVKPKNDGATTAAPTELSFFGRIWQGFLAFVHLD